MSQRLLPSTTLRTGGSFSVRTNGSQETSYPSNVTPNAPGNQHPECKGERIDLLVRLGLLKLVSEISGLTQEALPETLKLNSRLRAVQDQFQKIIVIIATSTLVLRQTLLSEKIAGNAEDMENMVSGCFNQVSVLVDTVDNAGIEDIFEILSMLVEECNKSTETVKIQSRKSVMSRMLTKSLQAGDAVFVRVSRAVYLAARVVVLGDIDGHGRLLSKMAIQQVGAAVLTDRVAEAAEVLVVAATVSGTVHGPWYAQIIENM